MHLKLQSVCVCVCLHTEIEMVVMEKCRASELTEQNITDEEKTAAATRTHTERSRYRFTHSFTQR